MSCQIIREDGKLTNVLAENGMPSQLYGSLRDFLSEEESLAIWTATQTPQFKEWFKGSQFVDSNGEPMLFFHGSREQFDEFKADERRYATHKLDRDAFFFTDKRRIAMQYGDVLYPIFLNAQTIEKHSYNGSLSVREFRDMESKFINSADTDGVVLDTLDKGGRQKQYVVFDTTQIRSVFNIVDPIENVNTRIKTVKSGVPELFEANESLANAVYEALGFKYLKNFDGNINLLASDIASNYDGAKKASDFIPEIQKDLQQAQQLYAQYLEQNPNGSAEEFKSWVNNNQLNVQYQLPQGREIEEFVASEKTIRDLAARMSDRIGIPVRFESDRTKEYKGKLENGTAVINLAYATLDTPIHEILGHPIIRAIKYSKNIGGTITLKGLDTSTKKQELSQLYQNLLKELEYGRGKEVLDRIKRDYVNKNNPDINIKYNSLTKKWHYKTTKNGFIEQGKETFNTEQEAKDKLFPKYTLEEQQEEALVELLGLYTAGKLDNIKDGKLISLLKRLLKEMKAFMKQLLGQKEVEIDKLPDNMTLGDIADLLAYSNSKLILPGNEVVYTTPDNQQFKTYAEASKHISDLAKSVEDVDLSDVSIERKLSQEDLQKIEELENKKKQKEDYFNTKKYQQDKDFELYKLNKKLEELKNKKVEFYSQEPFLDLEDKEKYGFQDFDYIRVESTYGRGNEYHKDILGENYEGYYIHGYNTSTGKPKKKILPITKEQAINIWEKDESSKYEAGDRQEIFRTEDSIRYLQEDSKIKYEISSIEREIRNIKVGQNTIQNFIEKNKEYEQSKEIIEEWKKVNNIQYNPEEIYSRGQEFSSVVGAYSSFDVNLMMQNLLSHIEDNEKAGGKFAISAFTKPADKTIGHLEGGGGKIKFKIYPQSNDILWAANTDVYSGSVWDASEKVNKDKKSELLGVSYTKYPSLSNVNAVQPNLAAIVDSLNHHHNELGIVLTGNNFRLEYDEDIPYQTKKIIDGINKILDQKYGKLVKPESTKPSIKKTKEFEAYSNETKKLLDENKITIDEAALRTDNFKGEKFIPINPVIQPIQTNETLKEGIEGVKSNLLSTANRPKSLQELQEGDGFIYFEENGKYFKEDLARQENIEITKEEYEGKKEYTEQALINTKIARLKEVAKKYPRSLIRSEVRSIPKYEKGDEYYEPFKDELPFQKVSDNSFQQFQQSLNKPNTNPILQGNQQEQVKKFAELQERLNNKEFLEGAKNAFESTPALQQFGTQEQYNDYIARVSLGIIKNPSSGEYNYTSKVKDIVYHGSKTNFEKFSKDFFGSNLGQISPDSKLGFFFSNLENAKGFGKNIFTVLLNMSNPKIVTEEEYKKLSGDTREFKNKVFSQLLNEAKQENKDSLLADFRVSDYMGSKQYIVFEPEQIHILGSKQDIEGFREFVDYEPVVFKQLPKVDYQLKAVNIITKNIGKIQQWFKQLGNTDKFWQKLQQDLQIPKEQIALLKESEGNTIEEKLTSFATNYSYTIEINTAKEINNEEYFEKDGRYYFWDRYSYIDGGDEHIEITKEQYEKGKYKQNTQHYSNLTVPGGTNYTENAHIIPSMKGKVLPDIYPHHDQEFAKGDLNMYGWDRSDEKVKVLKRTEQIVSIEDIPNNFYFEQVSPFDQSVTKVIVNKTDIGWEFIVNNKDRYNKKDFEVINAYNNYYRTGYSNENVKEPKTRRILEVQSKFQKWRLNFKHKGNKYQLLENQPTDKPNVFEDHYLENGKRITGKEYNKIFEEFLDTPTSQEDAFIKLIAKQWETLMIKSIIQNSAKKGYEKVLFPSGNTASKVEGHTTLEEFKKQKEDRIKELERQKQERYDTVPYVNDELIRTTEKLIEKGIGSKELHEMKLKKYKEQKRKGVDVSDLDSEIEQLKQELERVETEGFGALRPIYNFYENTVTNILKKQGYNPVLITDEYGDTWNEVTITNKHFDPIFLQKLPKEYKHFPKILMESWQLGTATKGLIRHLKNLDVINKRRFKGNHWVRKIDRDSKDRSMAGYQDRIETIKDLAAKMKEYFGGDIITIEPKGNGHLLVLHEGTLAYSAFEKKVEELKPKPTKKKRVDDAANDAALDKKMKDVMSLMGIKMADYEDYRQWYEKKYGKPLNAIGVADMLHKVIAVKEGHTDISTLPEEVGHFIIWAMKDDAVMKEMMANAHLSEEWTLHSEEYLADYNGDEQMVRMEIIGKMLANQIVNDHRSGIVKPYWRQKLEQLWRKFLNMLGVKQSEKDLLKSKISEISSDVMRGDVAKYGNRLQKGKQLSDVKIFKKLEPKNTINSKVFDGQVDAIDKAIRIHEDRIRYYKSRNMEGFVKAEEDKIALLKTQKKAKRYTYSISKIIKEAFDHTERIQQRIDSLEKQKKDGTITDNLIQNARILDEMKDHSDAYKDLMVSILDDLESVDKEGMTEADKSILDDALYDARYINRTIDKMSRVYKEYSLYLVAEWIKPVFNNIRYSSEADRQAAINSLKSNLSEGLDISNIDASVRSMATSRSGGDILSLIDARIKTYIEAARLQTEEDKHDILEIHENYGLNDTSFMYETLNGVPTGYIISNVNHGAFEAEKRKVIAELRSAYISKDDDRKWTEVYAELSDEQKKKYDTAVAKWFNANTETRPDAEKIKKDMRERIYNVFVTEKYNDDVINSQKENANREYNNWLSRMRTYEYENGQLVNQGFKGILVRPMLSKYSNPAFARLNAAQKKYYDDMMEKREQLFVGLNTHQRFSMIAPQVRKDWLERLKAGGNYKENLIEFTKELYMPTEDDTEFIRLDEGGKRIQAPPLYFFDKIDNKLNLSTDFTGGMVMLVDTTSRHKTLSAATSMIRMVQDVVDKRTILSGRKDDQRNEIIGEGGNTAKRLRDFIEMNVYGQQKEREIYAKAVDTFMTYTALNTLALNVFAGVNNSILGNLMIKQEQISQKYVNKENIKFADKVMSKKALSEVMNDVGKLTTTSKLRLFLDKVDALQDHKSRMHTNADRNRRSRMFNMSTLFFMTTFGEWQIGARMALAMADTVKLKDKDGNSINMYDAFEVKGKRLIIKEGVTNEDGSAFTEDNIIPFNMRLAQINQSMHGIYNDIDKSALQRHAIGRLIFQFRKYFVPQFDRRWADKHINAALGEEEEGYYRTAARVWKKLHDETNAMKFILMMKSPMNADGLRAKGLTDLEISNTIKTATEIYFILGFMVIGGALSMLAEGIDDDDEPILSWNLNMAAYQLQRLSTEMGAYILPNELLKLMSSPAASVNQLSHITKFFTSFNVNPFDDEEFIRHYKSGRNKDDARIYVWTKKAIPLVDTIEDWFYPEEKRGYFNK